MLAPVGELVQRLECILAMPELEAFEGARPSLMSVDAATGAEQAVYISSLT